MTLRAGSLCTGYGGLDLAVGAVLGGDLAWVADNDPGAAKILASRFPAAKNLGDITAVDWATVEPVDVLCMGFPCTDISCAGKRAGLRKGTRSGVWFDCARAIAALRPPLVVIENVKELLSERADSDMEQCPWCLGDTSPESAMRALGAVLADLAEIGFDAEWVSVPAASAGACHLRWRVFILAWPAADADGAREGRPEPAGIVGRPDAPLGRDVPASHAECDGLPRALQPQRGPEWGTAAAWRRPGAFGRYEAAVRRHEHVFGRAVPSPVEPGRNGDPRLSPRFVEWMQGLPEGWVTGVPGLSRNAQLKALGNGVVPQQAELALRFLLARLPITGKAIA